MLRVIGGPGDPGSRIENRIGEPTANPYLYIASQLIAGRSGMRSKMDPGEPARGAYASDRPMLPRSLMEAVGAFANDEVIKSELGPQFHGYMQLLKNFEINRFLSTVTDWEQNEYSRSIDRLGSDRFIIWFGLKARLNARPGVT